MGYEDKRTTIKPWGREELWTNTNKFAGKILHILGGQRLSLQYHEFKSESIYVLEGDLVLFIRDPRTDDSLLVHTLKPGDCFHIPAKTVHRFQAPAYIKECILLEVSTPELDDVVRLEDDYSRV